MGVVSAVELTDGTATFPIPGRVPPGRYDIRAAFDDDPPSPAGQIEVRGDLELVCKASFAMCGRP